MTFEPVHGEETILILSCFNNFILIFLLQFHYSSITLLKTAMFVVKKKYQQYQAKIKSN